MTDIRIPHVNALADDECRELTIRILALCNGYNVNIPPIASGIVREIGIFPTKCFHDSQWNEEQIDLPNGSLTLDQAMAVEDELNIRINSTILNYHLRGLLNALEECERIAEGKK